MSFNIAIDGPAGAGKSTIARSLARSLGFIYVDTGAMYRAMAYYFLKNRIDPENKSGIEDACADVDITITYENGEQQVLLNGENITSQLRKESVGNMASVTSALPAVRIKLTQLQKKTGCIHGCGDGWKRYRNRCASRCADENLSHCRDCRAGKKKIRGTESPGNR